MPYNSLLDPCLTLFVPSTIGRNARSLAGRWLSHAYVNYLLFVPSELGDAGSLVMPDCAQREM